MRIFITGGCGFIGSHLAEYHLKNGDEVHVVDDLSTGTLNNISGFEDNKLFHCTKADLITWTGLNDAAKWADRIYHMAAVVGVFRVLAEPVKVVTTNIAVTERLFRACAESDKTPHVIVASTSSVYGPSERSALNEDDLLLVENNAHPLRVYAISKIADETIAIAYHKTHRFPVTIIRLFNIVGPRQTGTYGMVVPRFVKQACNNEDITVFGDGTQTRSFCDIRDMIGELNSILEQKHLTCEIVNLGNDREITINELAKMICDRAKSKSNIKHLTYKEAYGIDLEDIQKRKPDLSKLKRLTGFAPSYSLEQTIDDLILQVNNKHKIKI